MLRRMSLFYFLGSIFFHILSVPVCSFRWHHPCSCYVPFNIESSEKEDKEDVQPMYELPDGQIIKVRCIYIRGFLMKKIAHVLTRVKLY